MRLVDLTHPIAPGMPAFPGTPSPSFREDFTIAEHGFREREVTMISHTGTHADAPAHILPGGATFDAYGIDRFAGRAVVVDAAELAGADGLVGAAALATQQPRLQGADFVLLRTGWSRHWGQPAYFSGFPCLAPDGAQWLVDRGVRGFGVDAVSVDPADSTDLPVHKILLGAEVLIVENLAGLDALPAGAGFEFLALPLRLADADGAPVRAVARLDG